MSYRDYLLKVVGVSEDCLFFVKGVWALGLDTCTAWFAVFRHAPGFEGLTLKRPANSPESEKMHNDDYHLPGGNGDVARLIIRSLIPDALPPGDVFDVADKRMDYAVFRSAERRVGKECVSTCRSWWSPDHSKNKQKLEQ